MSDLTRVTANLTPKALTALETAVRVTGDTWTETICRALRSYCQLVVAVKDGQPELRISVAGVDCVLTIEHRRPPVFVAGLGRCCIATLNRRRRPATEGEIQPCDRCTSGAVFRAGAWRHQPEEN